MLDTLLDTLSEALQKKVKKMKSFLDSQDSVLVAFSGGVDSTVLLALCAYYKKKSSILKSSILSVTLRSPLIAKHQCEQTKVIAQQLDIPHIYIESQILTNASFAKNTKERCYFCKHYMYSELQHYAHVHGFDAVLDGSHVDDMKEFRPGYKAIQELDIATPLLDAGFTKQDLRSLGHALKIPNADQPSTTCFATRFAYEMPLDSTYFTVIEALELDLKKEGFTPVRVRVHPLLIRIELHSSELARFINHKKRSHWIHLAKQAGFKFITLDMEGYRSGSFD